jgi:hypothetical protein
MFMPLHQDTRHIMIKVTNKSFVNVAELKYFGTRKIYVILYSHNYENVDYELLSYGSMKRLSTTWRNIPPPS